jgi:hypothetical protein
MPPRGAVGHQSGEGQQGERRQQAQEDEGAGASVESKPYGVEDADLLTIGGARVVDQLEYHGGADEGDRHRHEDEGLGDVAPADAVRQLRGEQAEGGRRGGHDDQP